MCSDLTLRDVEADFIPAPVGKQSLSAPNACRCHPEPAPRALAWQVPAVPKDRDILCDAGQSGVAPPAPTNQTWALLPDPNLPPTPHIPEFRSLLRGMCQHPTSGSEMPTFVADWSLFLSSVKKKPNPTIQTKATSPNTHTHKGNQQVETTRPALLAPPQPPVCEIPRGEVWRRWPGSCWGGEAPFLGSQ